MIFFNNKREKTKESLILEVYQFIFEDLTQEHFPLPPTTLLYPNGEYIHIDDYQYDYIDNGDEKKLRSYDDIISDLQLESGGKYFLFKVKYASPLMQFEIDEISLQEVIALCEDTSLYDILSDENLKGDIIDVCNPLKNRTHIPPDIHLIFDMEYVSSYDYYGGGTECELYVGYVGYMGSAMIAPDAYVLTVDSKKDKCYPLEIGDLNWFWNEVNKSTDLAGYTHIKELNLHCHADEVRLHKLEDWFQRNKTVQ
jgi:hypothetical protein